MDTRKLRVDQLATDVDLGCLLGLSRYCACGKQLNMNRGAPNPSEVARPARSRVHPDPHIFEYLYAMVSSHHTHYAMTLTPFFVWAG